MEAAGPRKAGDTPGSAIDFSNPEFQRLRQLVDDTSQSVFLTGKAGTGKSTFLRYIIDNTSKKCVVLAPTGIAAVNVGGQTLHSFFHLPLQPVLPDDPEFAPARIIDRLQLNGRCRKLLKEVELIVIDEISMVRADVVDLIDRILRTVTGERRKPFGGKQMLLVGDVFQLEPVVTSDDKAILQHAYRSFFFFNARVFAQFGLVAIELRKVYRQKKADFVEVLDRFRVGIPSHADIDAVNSRIECDEVTPTDRIVMTLAARRETVKRINDRHLRQIEAPEHVYTGEVSGDFPASAYPTDLELRLKEGAQVIFLRNDVERRYVNGTLGIVTCASPEKVVVRLESGAEIDVEQADWENVSFEYDSRSKRVSARVKGLFRQYPLKAAWALTIHKSQGLTFDNIVIDLGRGGAFAGGQVYVALSRCTSLEGIRLLSPVDARDVFVSPEVLRFSHSFNNLQDQENALRKAKAARSLEIAAKAFAAGDFREAVEEFNEAVMANPALNTPALRRMVAMRMAKKINPGTKRKKRK